MARASAGEPEAFRTLVERHRDRAYRLALRVVRSPRDAEEVAQDAFVRAWRGLPRFRAEASFATWLYRIVCRLAFERSAALGARRARETGVEALEEVSAASDVPDAPEAERLRRLERLVANLPEIQRAVVTLFYYQDRSVKDVARILALNENTVKTHLARARAALRAAWLRRSNRVEGSPAPGDRRHREERRDRDEARDEAL